jgi:hypothetical protein
VARGLRTCRKRTTSRCQNWRRTSQPSVARKPIPPRSPAGSSATATALKKTLLASECDRPDIRQAREEWRAERQPKMRLEPHRLVFLDKTGTTTKMTRPRGRCLKGERLRSKAPFGHWKTQTFIAGLRCDALTAPFVVDAPMDRRIFETYVETQLAPTLEQGVSPLFRYLSAFKTVTDCIPRIRRFCSHRARLARTLRARAAGRCRRPVFGPSA